MTLSQDIDKAISNAIYVKFGREIADAIGQLWIDHPLRIHSLRPTIQIPSISAVSMLREHGLASYLVRAEIRSGPKEDWLGAEQVFSDRELFSCRDQMIILDYSLQSIREMFLHHLAEREVASKLT